MTGQAAENTETTKQPPEGMDPEQKPVGMNILQRINEVRKDVEGDGYIKKDSSAQGYKAVSHDAVTAAARPALIKHGVVVAPTMLKEEATDTGSKTSSGKRIALYKYVYRVAFINIDNPSDVLAIDLPSHAEDFGDKAPGKGLSYAVKYAILKVLNIETGEDDEGRIESVPAAIGDTLLEALVKDCEDYGFPPEATLKALATKVYKVADIKQLPEDLFTDARARLKKKHEDAQAEPPAEKKPPAKKAAPKKKAAAKRKPAPTPEMTDAEREAAYGPEE